MSFIRQVALFDLKYWKGAMLMIKKINPALSATSAFFCIIGILCFSIFGQTSYPPTLKVPVTFYDFHSDGSNPEFEKNPGTGATHLGMVADTLDAQRKPLLGSTPYWNCYIAKWFRPWQPGDSTIPNYTNPATTTCSNGITKVAYDTAFKNVVIQDTLLFALVPGSQGTYSFNSQAFFPLDNMGFGADEPRAFKTANPADSGHNYSFSMELHWEFVKVPGLSFQFAGDDDMWAFIDNKLVMDIGGIHNTTVGTLNVDSLTNLTNGNSYKFDVFYCERHATGSDIRIETNIFTPPAAIRIFSVKPPNFSDTSNPVGALDTAFSGSPFNLAAHVFDSTGTLRPQYDSLITWTMTESTPLGTKITKLTGDSTALLPSKAYGTVTLTATYKNPNDPQSLPVVRTITVFIGPGKPFSLEIDTSSAINLAADTAVKSILIDTNRNQANLYAIIRDSVGNFVDSAKAASWISSDPTLGAVTAPGKKWQSTVTKVKPGQIIVTVSSAGLIPASITVTLLTVHINNVIFSGPAKNPVGPSNPITTNATLVFYQNVISKAGGSTAGGSVSGAIIGIETLRQLVPNPNGSFGEAAVYDALGNLVVKGLRVDKAEGQSSGDHHLSYGIYWDCHNRDHRWVGNGTYLIVASITTTDGVTLTTSTLREKIGFTR